MNDWEKEFDWKFGSRLGPIGPDEFKSFIRNLVNMGLNNLELVEELRKQSAGYGFVTDESIARFEEHFVIPILEKARLQGREEEIEENEERVMKLIKLAEITARAEEKSRIVSEIEKIRILNCYSNRKGKHSCDSVCEALNELKERI